MKKPTEKSREAVWEYLTRYARHSLFVFSNRQQIQSVDA